MRIVADANILIASIFWNGVPYQIVQHALDGKLEIFTSSTILDEVRNALREPKYRFELSEQEIEDIVQGILLFVRLVEPAQIVPVVKRDPSDDHIVACALTAKADAIVTRDGDLLDLKEHQGIKMLTPDVFLNLL